ncbi:glycosyltransferase family 10 domain-containing protein [Marinoscillum pacificum]|uniref:glycosyltransferase family 10 domain-containing protein n=1 Tax=Marinoscillum pacificum TaxID=392723 RepID=UPI002157CFE1|nr:glycosyltransferase family 10 [Marinoscillum pacificum]
MLVRLVKDWQKDDDLLHQTIAHSGEWNGVKFTLEAVSECDVVVFLNRVKHDEQITCRKGGRWLLQMEPPTPAHAWYRRSDREVDHVIGPEKARYGVTSERTHGALPWHLNKSYDFLKELKPKEDPPNLVSMITSNANWMAGHDLRNAIVKRQQCGELRFDLFGRGYNPIEDKFDALFPYRYSIVVENSFCPNYWTEKIADCLLSWTVPVYMGATNIDQFFPEGSFIQVDPDVDSLKEVLTDLDQDNYQGRLLAIAKAREMILDKYQLFPFLSERVLNSKLENSPYRTYQLKGNRAPWEGGTLSLSRKIQYQWRKLINKKPY